MRRGASSEGWRLLRVLLVRIGPLSTGAGFRTNLLPMMPRINPRGRSRAYIAAIPFKTQALMGIGIAYRF